MTKIKQKDVLLEIKHTIKCIEWQLKNGSWVEDAKKGDPYWKGFRHGLNSAITDYIYGFIEQIVGKNMDDYFEEFEKL